MSDSGRVSAQNAPSRLCDPPNNHRSSRLKCRAARLTGAGDPVRIAGRRNEMATSERHFEETDNEASDPRGRHAAEAVRTAGGGHRSYAA